MSLLDGPTEVNMQLVMMTMLLELLQWSISIGASRIASERNASTFYNLLVYFYENRYLAPKLERIVVYNGDSDPCVSYEGLF